MILVIGIACAALVLLFWAIVHVGARNDPPGWDE
jgi:hypothetical protein